jgi:ABC-type lipoprotein release transport system permease subunit
MKFYQLILRSLGFYWKSHLLVVIGVAICAMVITGTLIVGDSIRYSLEQATELRLGKATHLFTGVDRYFRTELANELKKDLQIEAAPILQLYGLASLQGGKLKLNQVQVNGIDGQFQNFLPTQNQLPPPADGSAYISENLAQRLQLGLNDAMLLRIERASQIPKNAPFVTDQDNQVSIRTKISRILTAEELGRFNLKTSQTAPYNVFLSIGFLNEEMGLDLKANKIIFEVDGQTSDGTIMEAVRNNWQLEDLALQLSRTPDKDQLEIRSDRIFMDSTIVQAVHQIEDSSKTVLTYMVNNITRNGHETPYSFIAAGQFPGDQELNEKDMIINTWLAQDLQASIGDSIEISYFEIGPLRELSEQRQWFTVKYIVAMEGFYADPSLMPDIPGMSDAGNCRDWEAGVPISLDKIRDKDEEYWNQHRGTPKAFITYQAGKQLWSNRFGVATSVRIPAQNTDPEALKNQLSKALTPESQGYMLRPVKEAGLTAARGGVDFGQLFMALSFFILISGLILMALLFNLHLEKRIGEIGTLKALGFTYQSIKQLLLLEGLLIAMPGVLLGGTLAILYNKVIFYALNTAWYEIVRTDILQEVVLVPTIIIGILISLLLVSISIWFNITRRLKASSTSLQRKITVAGNTWTLRLIRVGAWLTLVISIILLVYDTIFGQTLNTVIFFSSGGLLLLSFILFFAMLIRNEGMHQSELMSPFSLVRKNLFRNTARSFRIVILFALGTFIIISTGLNKKDLYKSSDNPKSGTGGFEFFMETTIPILNDLNVPTNRIDQGIEQSMNFLQMRKLEGDDASCLNLNLVSSPRILGIPSSGLSGRFTFIKSTDDLDPVDPWSSLKKELPGNIVPAVLDQTVIQWGLGKQVGDTLTYVNEAGREVELKIIGGLANSVFQGNVLIDEQLFLKHFPSNSGAFVFLIDGKPEAIDTEKEDLMRAFRNEGAEIQVAAERLAMFNQVENTYLSIFLLLGGLAMILGTVGLGVSLARSILDRGPEIGLLQAIGLRKSAVIRIITYEHMVLLLFGTLAGAITAFVSTLPSILSEFVQASWQTAAIIVSLIILNGLAWSYGITRSYLRKDLIVTLREE